MPLSRRHLMSVPAQSSLNADVAIVGAGVVGLACALGAAQAGLRVALIGPAPAAQAASSTAPFDARIYALSAGTQQLLQRLRVWPQIDAARLQPVARMRVFGDAGDELSFDAYGAAVERLATIAEERELLRVLSMACGFAGNITRVERVFAGVQIDADAAHVSLDDGSRLRCALLVGADGAESAVRAAAGINTQSHAYQQSGVVANFAAAQPHRGVAYQWFTEEGVVALLPLPSSSPDQHFVSLVWSAPVALAEQLLQLAPVELAQRVAERTQQMLGALTPAGAAHAFPLRRLQVDRLALPRVALVGDAAHVVHPLAGQGLNLGLQDVSELLRVLGAREAFRDLGDLSLLRRYERARAEPIQLMRFTTDGLARLFAAQQPAVKGLRNVGMSLVNALPPLKNALIRHALG